MLEDILVKMKPIALESELPIDILSDHTFLQVIGISRPLGALRMIRNSFSFSIGSKQKIRAPLTLMFLIVPNIGPLGDIRITGHNNGIRG